MRTVDDVTRMLAICPNTPDGAHQWVRTSFIARRCPRCDTSQVVAVATPERDPYPDMPF